MASDNGVVELYRKFRPRRFRDVVGQKEAVASLLAMLKEDRLPHCLLLSGPSGTGKTTIARILQNKLGCGREDFFEINAADSRGIDTVREVHQHMSLASWNGGCRIWYFDEAHKLTGDAQTALLKTLEDTPGHVRFFLASTDPQKLLTTIRTRCTEIKLQPLSGRDIQALVHSVWQKESGREVLPDDVIAAISEAAVGSARKALVLLHQVISLATAEEQLAAVSKEDVKKQSIDLCRALLDLKSKWDDIRKVIEQLEGEPEEIRRAVLGYASATLLRGGKQDRAYLVLTCFENHWYDSGKCGLTRACYEVFREKG